MGDGWKARVVIVLQIAAAVGLISSAYRHFDSANIKFEEASTIERRLALTLRYLAISLVPVLMAIGSVANARFFSSAIDPLSGNDALILTKQRILVNTMEQFVIHAFALLSYSTFLDVATFKFIPMLCGVFVIGRLLFAVGYCVHPFVRAFGFALTFYPTALTVVNVIWKLFDASFFDWILAQ